MHTRPERSRRIAWLICGDLNDPDSDLDEICSRFLRNPQNFPMG